MKLQSLMVGTVLFGLGIVGMSAAGCSATVNGSGGTSSSGTASGSGSSGANPKPTGAPAGCQDDPTLQCSPDALGVSCTSNAVPDSSTLLCSDGTDLGNGSFGYCCVDWTSTSGCTPDGTVQGCAYPSYGVSCPGGSISPDTGDPALTCSTPTPDPNTGADLYCCVDNYTGGSSSGGSGCSLDSSLACDPGTDGVDCVGGANPEAAYPGYICSAPAPQSDGSDGYCCATGFSGSTCAQDLSVAGCVDPSVGFSCAGTDTPDQADPALNCSAGVADPNTGDTLYCCQ